MTALHAIEFPRTEATQSGRDIVSAIHTGINASMVFMAKDGGKMRSAGACRADELNSAWPKLPHGAELYFSLNSTGKVYPWEKSPTGYGTSRKREHVRFLNASFIEFDRHDSWESVSFAVLASHVLRHAEAMGMPAPTYIVYSGRGVWAIWVYQNPIPATGQAKEHWQRVGRALLQTFEDLKPDPACSSDISRIMRVPGSVNSSAASHVVTFDKTGGTVEFYGLAKSLGIHNAPTPITKAEEEKREKNIGKVRAVRSRWRKMLNGFRKLAIMRGKFGEGQRSWAVFTLAKLGKLAGVDHEQMKRECLQMAQDGCSPAMDTDTAMRKFRSAQGVTGPGQWMSLSQLCKRFAVTDAERERITELQATYRRTGRTRGNGTPMYERIRPETRKKAAIRELRLLAVDLGRVPTFAEARAHFLERGMTIPVSTIYRHLATLAPESLLTVKRAGDLQPPAPPAFFSSQDQILNSVVRKNLVHYCSNSKNENPRKGVNPMETPDRSKRNGTVTQDAPASASSGRTGAPAPKIEGLPPVPASGAQRASTATPVVNVRAVLKTLARMPQTQAQRGTGFDYTARVNELQKQARALRITHGKM